MARRPNLRRLADLAGILPSFIDQQGTTRYTNDETREALLCAMGLDASTEASAGESLQRRIDEASKRLVEPITVSRGRAPTHIAVTLPRSWSHGARVEWNLSIQEESGTVHKRASYGSAPDPRALRIALPKLPLGYHRAFISLRAGGKTLDGEQLLVVAPRRCPTIHQLLMGQKIFGLLANLYTVRSRMNWGVGDLRDLRRLGAWAAENGADFIGINPLHAVWNKGTDISPYSPVSRLYRNLIYLDLEAVPELASTSGVKKRLASPAMRRDIERLRASSHVDYERIFSIKRDLLEPLHQTFDKQHRDADTARGRAYRHYLQQQSEALIRFATFMALAEHFEKKGHGLDWHNWPLPYRNPRSQEVSSFQKRHRRAVDFHCWVQFEIDRQLQSAAHFARTKGMRIGLYEDLAIGSSPRGSDPWMFAGLFLDNIRIGAPPDNFQPLGQNWNLPPIDPLELAEQRYEYWTRLLRNSFAHAGALRVDHVMGLFRQFWIPAGQPGSAGAYVRQPANELLGILALESARAGAMVIGEDLGTAPPGFTAVLRDWGIASTRVLYFERTKRRAFRAARAYPSNALATANTHDLATLEGFWTGRDIELKHALGLIRSNVELSAQKLERERDKVLLLRRLTGAGIVPASRRQLSGVELRRAVHTFLQKTPAALVGISLDDLIGERDPVNVPGVTNDRYPNWSRRMRMSFEQLQRNPAVRRALGRGRARGAN